MYSTSSDKSTQHNSLKVFLHQFYKFALMIKMTSQLEKEYVMLVLVVYFGIVPEVR